MFLSIINIFFNLKPVFRMIPYNITEFGTLFLFRMWKILKIEGVKRESKECVILS